MMSCTRGSFKVGALVPEMARGSPASFSRHLMGHRCKAGGRGFGGDPVGIHMVGTQCTFTIDCFLTQGCAGLERDERYVGYGEAVQKVSEELALMIEKVYSRIRAGVRCSMQKVSVCACTFLHRLSIRILTPHHLLELLLPQPLNDFSFMISLNHKGGVA